MCCFHNDRGAFYFCNSYHMHACSGFGDKIWNAAITRKIKRHQKFLWQVLTCHCVMTEWGPLSSWSVGYTCWWLLTANCNTLASCNVKRFNAYGLNWNRSHCSTSVLYQRSQCCKYAFASLKARHDVCFPKCISMGAPLLYTVFINPELSSSCSYSTPLQSRPVLMSGSTHVSPHPGVITAANL